MTGVILTATSVSVFSFVLSIYYWTKLSQSKQTRERVEKMFQEHLEDDRKSFLYIWGDKYDQSELSESLRENLAKANLNIKPSEYAAICIFLFAGLWFVNHFLLQLLFPLDLTLAYIIVWFGSKFFLGSRKNKRAQEFNKQLPEVCRMMSNTIKAGLTLHQGINAVSKELPAPAGAEFKVVTQELSFGDNFDEALTRMTQRIESEELKIFVNAIIIQRRVGGNLAQVLGMMANTLEERARVLKEVDTITAESKYIAVLLPLLPVAMVVIMNLVIPGFLNPLFTPLGLILLAVVVLLQVTGFFMIRQIAKIRV